jgi:hypothetical protein
MTLIYWQARKAHVYINDEGGIGYAAFKLIYDVLLNMGTTALVIRRMKKRDIIHLQPRQYNGYDHLLGS